MATLAPAPDAAHRAAFSSWWRAAPGLLLGLLLAGCDTLAPSPAPAPPSPAELGAPRSIGAVQGREARSPYEGSMVSVQGVVTGNFVSGLDGFFMQDATGAEDGDRSTSDAIFVQWTRSNTPKVRRGDRVSVLGRVEELGNGNLTLTSLVDAQVEVLGRGAVRATVIEAPPARAQDWEALEGMWLRIAVPLTVSGNGGLLRFGELHTAFGERLRVPTDVHPPGPKAKALAEDNLRRSLVLDDARSAEFPERIWYLDEPLSAEAPLRAGSVLHGVEGILDSRHGRWRLQLTEKIGRIEQAPRPPPPNLPQGLRLVSYNLENFFNGDGRGGGFPTERGARSKAEFERQRRKHVVVLATLLPDIAALVEVENDEENDRSALNDLLRALNAELGDEGDYAPVLGATPGPGPIRVALAYRSSRVATVGEPANLSSGPFASGSRPPIAQTFAVGETPKKITVVVNHFKSKGSCDPQASPGNRDQGDGQACWNAHRMEAARSLDLWMKSDPTRSGSPHRILLGDLNAYTREDPLRLLRSLGWRDALPIRSSERVHHSYVFGGEAGSLDHALLSPGLTGAVVAATIWQINSDESKYFDYTLEKRPATAYSPDPYASSDHDPLIVVLDPGRAAL